MRALTGLRPRLGGMVAAAALISLAAAPSAAPAADTTPPSAPSQASLVLDPMTYRMFMSWRVPTDNLDTPEDLKYRVFACTGEPIDFNGTKEGTDFVPTSFLGSHKTVYRGGPGPAAIAAVDRAGNVSASAPIRYDTWVPWINFGSPC